MQRDNAQQNGLTTSADMTTADLRANISPTDVILEAVKRFDDRSGAGFIGRELLRAGPGSSPPEALECSRILMEAGLVDESEALYLAMARSFPRHPGGFVGLAHVAMQRKNWHEAMTCWDRVLTEFDGLRNPFWRTGRALVLFELGRLNEAKAIVADVLLDFPDEPPGHVALAQLALRQRYWPESLIRCDEVLARFGDQAGAASWKVMRASALLQLGRAAEAEAMVKDVVERAPGSVGALLLLLWVFTTTGRPEAALSALESSPFREIDGPPLVERRLDLLIRLKRFDEAGAIFASILSRADRPDLLGSLFAFVPMLYDGHERQRIWTVLRERAGAIRNRLSSRDRVPLGVLDARIRLALRDRDGVISAIRDLAEWPHLGEHGEALRRVATVLSEPRYPDYTKPKIFGIGLSKTGTTSLAAALTLLGFSTLDWLNPLTRELISDDDLPVFDAFTDAPVSARFEFFYYLYPNSKFIFTTRPFEGWVTSISRHWRRHYAMADFDEIKMAMAETNTFHYGVEYRNIYRSLYFNYDSYRDAFEAHERRVRRFFQDKPADRFLELNIFAGDGWPKLCAFLGRDMPSVPYPWENRQPSPPVTVRTGPDRA